MSDPHAATLRIPDGTLEGLKWLALALMVLDHVNTFLYERKLPGAYEAGRLVAPMFAFVLACNLARPGARERGVHWRVMLRLAVFGALACPPFMALIGHWWPLNILFTLLAGTAVVYGLDRGDRAGLAIALLAFAVGGSLAEYHQIGLAVQVAAWLYCREPTPARMAVWVASVAALGFINKNLWAMAALPLLWLAPHVDLRVPRLRWLFYGIYPAHLALLWWWKTN